MGGGGVEEEVTSGQGVRRESRNALSRESRGFGYGDTMVYTDVVLHRR